MDNSTPLRILEGVGTATLSLAELAGVLVLLAGIARVVLILIFGPPRVSRVVPWSMRSLPHLRWRRLAFLGMGRGWGIRVHVWAGWRDAVGIIGIPGFGKTATLISQLRMWRGSAISTSTKADVIAPTVKRRMELAARHGGRIWLFAPTWLGEELMGLRPMNWSLLNGCDDLVVCQARVTSLIESVRPGEDMKNAGHWVASASAILRALFAAAALHPTRPGDMSLVLGWLENQQTDDPADLLRKQKKGQGEAWASRLEALRPSDRVNASEINSFWSTARSAVAGIDNPVVMARMTGTEFDPEEFVQTCSTLYIVAPPQDQKTIAPLVSALIESISQAQLKMRGRGLGTPPLLLSLDEVANIAPLPSLPTLVSQGGSQGVKVVWATQNQGQLRERYGVHAASAILDATSCKLITGGLTEVADLENFSQLCGEVRVKPRGETVARMERRMTANDLHRLSPHRALMLAQHHQPVIIRLPRYWRAISLIWSPTEQAGRIIARGKRQALLGAAWAKPRLGGLGDRLRLPQPQRRALPPPGVAASESEEIAE